MNELCASYTVSGVVGSCRAGEEVQTDNLIHDTVLYTGPPHLHLLETLLLYHMLRCLPTRGSEDQVKIPCSVVRSARMQEGVSAPRHLISH
jgi:hypothetical protein